MDVEELAESQYGLVTRDQACERMSESAVDRRLATGRWAAVHPGVYRIKGAPVTGRQRAMAATLWGGPSAAISHTAAARLLRLDAIKFERLHLTVDRRGLRSESIHIHTGPLTRAGFVRVDGIPCTSATRTLVDCALLVDEEVLETAVEHARRMGLTSIRAIERQLGRGRPDSAVSDEVLTHTHARPKESRLEVKLARLLRKSGLPKPEPQFEIGKYRVDYAWPAAPRDLRVRRFRVARQPVAVEARPASYRHDRGSRAGGSCTSPGTT